MSHIAVVTDSTTGISAEAAQELGIEVIPLTIHWGDENYKDGITLDSKTFYRWLQERKDFPKTSQPSAGEFTTFFTKVAEKYQTDTILGIFVSSELSGTRSSAMLAQQGLTNLNIKIVDSRSISAGAGMQVLAAARMAKEGAALEDILNRVESIRDSMNILFAVDTLEYLHKGGRIGGAARLLGTALNLKPLLELRDGRVESLEKVRRRRKSLERIVEVAETRLQGKTPAEVAILYTEMDADVEFLAALTKEKLQPKVLSYNILTPVVGTHSGPGSIGIVFYLE